MTVSNRKIAFQIPTRIILGVGKAKTFMDDCGLKPEDKILFAIDPGLIKLGITDSIVEGFANKNYQYEIYDNIEPNPTDKSVEEGAKVAREMKADAVIAIGGGSAIDVAKGIVLRATNDGFILDYTRIGNRTMTAPPLPLYAIPTTAGTGSEATQVSVITDTDNHRKLVVAFPQLFPKVAVLDPLLSKSLPAHLTAQTGMDALCHAIESYVTLNAEPITDAVAMGAIKIISNYLYRAVANGEDLEARSQMLLASNMAGFAFANAGLGIVHSTAHSLGGVINLGHGLSNAIMLPVCMEFNLIAKPEKFRDIAIAFGEDVSNLPLLEAAYKAVEAVKKLSKAIGTDKKLSDLGVTEDMLDELTNKAMGDAGTFPRNPRKANYDDTIGLYKKVF